MTDIGNIFAVLPAVLTGVAYLVSSRVLKRVEIGPPVSELDVNETADKIRSEMIAEAGSPSTSAAKPEHETPQPLTEDTQPSSKGREQAMTLTGHDVAVSLMADYMKDLNAEANRIARRLGAETASPAHVRLAADRIGIMRDRAGIVADLCLALGSLLIGVAASYQVNLMTGGQAAPTPVYGLRSHSE